MLANSCARIIAFLAASSAFISACSSGSTGSSRSNANQSGTSAGGNLNAGGNLSAGGNMSTVHAAGAGSLLGGVVGSLELYGTFHSMGVIATMPASSDGNGNAVANLEYRLSGVANYTQGFPLTRVDTSTFVGSLFWLKPGTSYDVRVRYADPDGAPLDNGWVGATAVTRDAIAIPAPIRTLAVSPNGTGTTCSVAAPCALSNAIGQAQAGDEVLLGAGTYFTGELTISRSGTSTAPIVIRGMTGAILDGADPAKWTWASQGGGVFSTTVNRPDPHLVTADGMRLYPYVDLASLAALSATNTPGLFADGTTLSVHLAGGTDPANVAMSVSRFNSAFTITGSFVYVLDLTIQNYGQGEYAKAIYVRGGSDNLVQRCRFINNDLGIGLKGTTHRNVIEDNEFSDTIFNWTWEDVKAEGHLETGGVRFFSPDDGRGTVIRRNKFHDNFDGLGICPKESSAVTNETDFYDNESYNLGDDGVETDGRCANVRLWGNTFHDSLSGISLAPVAGGPIYCLRNQIYMTGAGRSEAGYTGLPFKFNSGDGASGAIYLLHNTVDAQRASNSGFRVMSPGTWQLIYSRNNVWSGTLHAMENANPTQPLDLDYDDLWRSGSDYLVYWDGLTRTHPSTIPEIAAATGQESHGIVADPQFLLPLSADFTPGLSSPLVDRGIRLPGINDDFAGAGPDIGAVERR